MRGGALPVITWALLLVALGATNAVWTHDGLQVGEFGLAIGVLVVSVLALAARTRRALRPGPPEQEHARAAAAPDISFGAGLAGVSFATILFGLTFGDFFVFLGAGLLLMACGRLLAELRSQRADLARIRALPAPEERIAAEQEHS